MVVFAEAGRKTFFENPSRSAAGTNRRELGWDTSLDDKTRALHKPKPNAVHETPKAELREVAMENPPYEYR